MGAGVSTQRTGTFVEAGIGANKIIRNEDFDEVVKPTMLQFHKNSTIMAIGIV